MVRVEGREGEGEVLSLWAPSSVLVCPGKKKPLSICHPEGFVRGLGFTSNRRAERPARGRRCSQRLTRGSRPRAGEHFREGRLAARAPGAPGAAPPRPGCAGAAVTWLGV